MHAPGQVQTMLVAAGLAVPSLLVAVRLAVPSLPVAVRLTVPSLPVAAIYAGCILSRPNSFNF